MTITLVEINRKKLKNKSSKKTPENSSYLPTTSKPNDEN
jgi:hypothetical protein